MQFAPDPSKGVFTTARVADGHVLALGAHVARLSSSALELYARLLPGDVADRARALAVGEDDKQIRINVVPEAGGVRVEYELAPRLLPPDELRLQTTVVDHWAAAHKWCDRPPFERGTALVVDPAGNMLEVDNASIFAAFGDRIVTPSAATVLPGVARAAILHAAEGLGYATEVRSITLETLMTAEVVLVANSARGLMQVRSVDGQDWPAIDHPTFATLRNVLDKGGWNIDVAVYNWSLTRG